MTHSAETLFFDIKRRHGLLFVELRTRDTGRLLDPEEALKVSDLPEGFTLEPNPETPGKNAFISKVHKGPMMTKVMQDAGFRYDAEDVVKFDARVIEHAKLEKEKQAMAAMKQLIKALQGGDDSAKDKIKEQVEAQNPGSNVEDIDIRDDGMVVVSLSNPQPERAPAEPEVFAEKEKVRFKVGTRHEEGQKMVRVVIETFEEGRWECASHDEFSDLPEFLSADASRLFASSLSEGETRTRLAALGWAEESRAFLWYQASQLAFGVDTGDTEDGPAVFIAPIEERADFDYDLLPFEDNLHGDCLATHPDFLGHTTSENTFELAEDLGPNEIKMRMMALGFIHDPKLDELSKGGLPLSGAGQPTGFGPASSPAPTPKALSDQAAIRFNTGTRIERDEAGTERQVVRVAVEVSDGGGWTSTDNIEITDLPDFLSVDKVSRLYASSLSEDETRTRLTQLGWTDEPRVFLWYRWSQLAFGVNPEGDLDGPWVHLYPVEDRCDFDYEDDTGLLPFEEDLRLDAIEGHPAFIKSDPMENTLELTEDLDAEEIKKRMLALGATYDADLDTYY